MTQTDTPTATSTSTGSPAKVGWFEIHTADPQRARAFYGAVFGWTFEEMMPGYDAIGQLDPIVQGGLADTGGDSPSDAVFCVDVPDIDATMAAVVEAGGSVVAEVTSLPTGLRFSYVADPDGSVVGLFTPPAAA